MENGIINTDTNDAKDLGFTSDKFSGYLWKEDKFIWISFIHSLQERKGNLISLFKTIEAKGYKILVPTPFPRMETICRKYGMDKFTNGEIEFMARMKLK